MHIRIGTSEIDGTFHRQGEAVATILRATHTVETEPMSGSSVGSALGLHSGDLQFGFSASNWVGRALRGEEPFKEPIDIRMAAPANVGPMFFVVRADSDLHTIDDMKGRKVSVNVANSGMYQHTRTIFGILGISFDEFEPVHLTFEEGAAALKAGKIDAQWQCPIPNPVMTELADSTDVRVLEYGPGQLEKVIAEATFYRRAVMPVGAFRGIEQETAQVAVLNVIATHERVDDAMVHEFVSTMVNNAKALGETQELYRGLADLFAELKTKGQSVFEPGGVSLHPGAVQAYRDAGLLS
ncbi:MAG: TAXI family TRAP transporter solute-binding subunit [Alphaproteobacteria bacterium]|nr:TAXI family TRAP transporter solute-binding subunit [Alphaproteobacteria bacterium]